MATLVWSVDKINRASTNTKNSDMKTALPHQPQYHEDQKKQIKNVNSQSNTVVEPNI